MLIYMTTRYSADTNMNCLMFKFKIETYFFFLLSIKRILSYDFVHTNLRPLSISQTSDSDWCYNNTTVKKKVL